MTGRDLSAFQPQATRATTVPPPPRQAPAPAGQLTPPATPAVEPARRPSPRSAGRPAPKPDTTNRRVKVMTGIPAELHQRLRQAADQAGTYKADVVLGALARHRDALRTRSGPGQTRRRRVADATQCQLYLTDAQRSDLDDLAQELGLSRSDLVTRLLELELTGPG